MSKLDDLISDLCLAIAENLSGSNGDNYRVIDVKQAIKDLMIELIEEDKAVPRPLDEESRAKFYRVSGQNFTKNQMRKKVQEL